MKLVVLLLTVTCLQLRAASYAQEVTLRKKNAPLGKIFEDIYRQTGYQFAYTYDLLKQSRKVSIDAVNMPLKEALDLCFKNQPFTYVLVGKAIIVQKKPAPEQPRQQALPPVEVSGRVTDSLGNALVGVTIKVKDGSKGVVTDAMGGYTILAPDDGILVISYIGYLTREVAVGGRKEINIILKPAVSALNQLVVVGYGTQLKSAVTGSVSSVSAKEINTTTNENVENMLTGKLPGVRVLQSSSEPGSFNNAFDIRGFGTPLIVVDGVPRSNIARLDPHDIESISVLKDASAAIYGVRAANGVVLVTTKHGKPGSLELNYTGTAGLQHPSGLPRNVNAADWMTLKNEQQMHNPDGGSLAYPLSDVDAYRKGIRKSADWFAPVIDPSAFQTEHNLSARGGTDKMRYYMSLGYLKQGGFWKSGDLNYERYNFRSNVSSQITTRLKAELSVSAIMDQKNQPYSDSWGILKSLWRQIPTQTPYANGDPKFLGNTLDGTNPAAMTASDVSGYKTSNNKWLQSAFTLSYDIPGVEGLLAKGMFSYDYTMSNSKRYQKAFNLYNYDSATQVFSPVISQSPSNLYRGFTENPSSLLQLSLSYDHRFHEAHHVSGLVLFEQSTQKGDNFYASRDLALEVDQLIAGSSLNQQGYMNANGLYKQVNEGLVGRFNYDYKSKYLFEFSFRYDGSSKFPPGRQWGFFPAVSAGWLISRENFIQENAALSFISNLKLRASYGKMGDDAASSYQFISGYTYPASGGSNQGLASGYVFDDNFVSSIGFTNLPNPNITWFTVNTFNAGIDLDMWNGLLGVTADAFVRRRNGLLATELLSLPASLGASLPQENLNSDQTSGFEISVNHRNTIGKLGYYVSGNFSYTRTRWIGYVQARAGNSYQNWRNNLNNRYNDIWWGYGAAGQYGSYQDIINSPVYAGRNTLPGDYVYQDWNQDGIIDDWDTHPIASGYNGNTSLGTASPNPPAMYFGLTLGADYKGFDLNALFQGAAMTWIAYPEQLAQPLAFGGSALQQFMDRWHPADPTADPYDPATEWIPGYYAYTGTVANATSGHAIKNAAYLRLKSVELGYTLPEQLTAKAGIKNIRVFVNGYNLITFTGIRYVDPEHPSNLYGYVYPLNKTYNAGLSITF
ncbi:TonB-dependent receptor [Compostibacter hankyongensis]|uniref:TonB-dependent receptor n=1 Tax=Compostibacter hankyongensis TaxID=1007089 RepID=A0ABP8G163_9BACT